MAEDVQLETLRLGFDHEAGIATVTLENGPVNTIDDRVCRHLVSALATVEADPQVGAVVLTGAGRAFSAGGDLKSLGDAVDDLTAARAFMTACHRVVLTLSSMEKPVIAAVNGDAAGAGWSIALACDMIVASQEARFVMAFVRVGLVPDLGAAWFLPRLVGPQKAREWMMLGETVTAEEAHRLGAVNRLAPAAEVIPVARELARNLAGGPRRALALMKQMTRRYMHEPLEAALEHEAFAQAAAFQTDDFREGVRAFFEKRPPRFGGQ